MFKKNLFKLEFTGKENVFDILLEVVYTIDNCGQDGWKMPLFRRTRGCTGFDGGSEAGEAIRTQCVKWQK